MKKTLLFLTVILTLTMANAQVVGDTFSVGDYNYYITSADPLEVTVTGASNATLTALVIPSEVTNNSKTHAVTSISTHSIVKADGAFNGNIVVTSISLPSSVTKFGIAAFLNMSSLESINLDNVVETGKNCFANCVSLTSIGTPDKLTTLADYTFNNCVELKTLNFPALVSIGVGAIYNSKFSDANQQSGGISEFNIPSTVTSIDNIFLGGLWDLTKVQVNWSSPYDATMGPNNFFRWLDLSAITLFVPAGTRDAYINHASWGVFPPANIVEGTLGVQSLEALNTSVYPNPTSGNVFVQTEQHEDVDLTVFDLNGRVLKSVTGTQIDISDLAQGVYILKGKTQEGEFTQRIVKQ